MQIYLRLDEFLRLDEMRPRDVRKLAEHMELSKYQLELLVKNKWKALKQETLSRICDYLVTEGLVNPADLPHVLFGRAPSAFWQMLCERERIITCMGYRQDEFRDRVVIAADAQLQANVLYCMTQASAREEEKSRTKKTPPREEETPRGGRLSATGTRSAQRMPPIIDPWLVRTWERKERSKDAEVIVETNDFYERFTRKEGDRALVCFGSIKSNPVIERVIASSFMGAVPFQSQDDLSSEHGRSCPFLFAYREFDPKPTSVCGGLQLSGDKGLCAPGIHYATLVGENEDWLHLPWTEPEHDAALVFYRFIRSQGRFELVLGGFSGRGTKFLAKLIRDRQEMLDFWPPTVSTGDVDLGTFVVRFQEKPSTSGEPQMVPEFNDYQVIPLKADVLLRRMGA